MKVILARIAAIFLIFCCADILRAQQTRPIPELFERLQSEDTTDESMSKFLELGPSNSSAHEYLVRRLPPLIGEGPKPERRRAWLNSVRLAGEFRITAAIPSLTKFIDANTGATSGGLHATAQLLGFPCAQALIRIGDPAVPGLREVLEKGNARNRWFGYRTLFLIGSPPAISALRDHLNREQDKEFKAEIEQALDEKK